MKFSDKLLPDREFKELFRDTVWSFQGKIYYAASQAVYYILLARILGASQFGIFAGLIAFFGFFYPFLGLGRDSMLVRDLSRDPDTFSRSFAHALLLYLVTGLILSGLAIGINEWILQEPFAPRLFIFIIIAELLYRATELVGRVFQGLERLKPASVVWSLAGFSKLAAVLAFMLLGDESLETWSFYYLAASLILAFTAYLSVFVKVGFPRFNNIGHLFSEWSEGLAFSITYAANKIYSDVDKFMLLKLASGFAAGIYSAAYQFLKAAFFPVSSVLLAAYPRFFKKGSGGFRETLQFALSILKYAAPFALVVSLALFLLAPLVPWVLGREYADSVSVLQWLAVVPFIQTLYHVLADAFSGADLQKLRSRIQVMAVIVNVGLNFWLIPLYSWWGAVVATIASETTLLLIFSAISIWMWRNTEYEDLQGS